MSNQMSREQAALNMLHLLNMDEGRAWNNKHFTPCEKQSIEMAIAALRFTGPQPDPITGLVPCGCGGVAEELFDGFSFDGDGMECNDYLVKCQKCGMQTQVIQTWSEKARDIWNTAMGYKGGAK